MVRWYSGKETLERIRETRNGCDHKCGTCILWQNDRQQCVYESHRQWQEWAKQRHEDMAKLLAMYEVEE